MNNYIPKCVRVIKDNSGHYVAQHDVKSACCKHKTDGVCRIIGTGQTRQDCVADARQYLELD